MSLQCSASKGCRGDPESQRPFEAARTGVSQAEGAIAFGSGEPSPVQECGEESHSEGTADVRAPLGPIQAGLARGRKIHSQVPAPLAAAIGEAIPLRRIGGYELTLDERLVNFDRQRSGKVAVATAGETHLPGRRNLRARRRQRGDGFDGGGNAIVGQAVVTVPALAHHGNQRCVQQFTEVKTGGGRGDIADGGQFSGRQSPAIDERRQNGRARRLSD